MNSSNETFYPLDYWLNLYGYPYFLDLITVYVITPIWFLSFILSIFSLFILFKTPFFASNFFNYMRLYVANCLILSLLSLTSILATTHNFFSITNSFEAVFYSVYIFTMAQNCLFLFSSSIEICLVIERILYLLPRGFKRIKFISFKKFFLVLFFLCILVNLPGVFFFEPAFADIQLNQNTLFRIWYFGLTSFSSSLAGQVIYYLGYLFRDVLPMALKIIFNSLSIYLVGNYVRNKQRIRAATRTANSELVSFDRKQTYVALVMNTFSLVEHILYITSYALYFVYIYDLSNIFYIVALLIISIKHFFIFFVLLTFNKLFRIEVFNCFKIVTVEVG